MLMKITQIQYIILTMVQDRVQYFRVQYFQIYKDKLKRKKRKRRARK